jgi:hypothetical protein
VQGVVIIATSAAHPSALTPTWEVLDDRARAYAEAARAPATLRAYAADWGAFRTWCAQHAVDALPATPHTLTLFLADLSGRPGDAAAQARRDRRHAPLGRPRLADLTRHRARHLGWNLS